MYFHLVIALSSWLVGTTIPSLPPNITTSAIVFGCVAFFLFLKEILDNATRSILLQAAEAEHKDRSALSTFRGTFLTVREDKKPISDEFSYIVFYDGEMEIPLYCRNEGVIQKASQMKSEMIIFYEDYILVDVQDLHPKQKNLIS